MPFYHQGIKDYAFYYDDDQGLRCWSKKGRGRFMKQEVTANGYARYQLNDGVKQRHFRVHRIIMENLVPNPENKPAVDHIDRNRLNNYISNLRWATTSENNKNRD